MDHLIIDNSTVLNIPKADGTVIAFDISLINRVIQEIPNIKSVTPATYGMIATDLLLAFHDANRLITILDLEKRLISNDLEVEQASILLNEVENILKTKNVKSSTDTREAAVTLHPTIQEKRVNKEKITALLEYAYSLRELLEKTYFSVKQIAEYSNTTPNIV